MAGGISWLMEGGASALPACMRRRELIVGLAVLALLAAGAWWARSRSPTAAPSSSGQRASAQSAGDEAIPDVTLAEGTADVGGVRITLSVTPNPPVAFATFRVRARAAANGAPLALEGGRISFEMVMPMGDHRYSLIPGSDGWQEAEVILPRCMSGIRRWYATVEGTVGGEPRTARFRLDLASPE
jgi:hypothetical protein